MNCDIRRRKFAMISLAIVDTALKEKQLYVLSVKSSEV